MALRGPQTIIYFCLVSFLFFYGIKAEAYGVTSGYTIVPSIFYQTAAKNNSEYSDNSTLLAIDLKIGHTYRNGLHYGLIYSREDNNLGLYSQNFSGLGLTVGFERENLFGRAHYYFTGRQDLYNNIANSPVGINGQGYGADVGFQFFLNKKFQLGAQVSYKSISYNEDTAGNNVKAHFSDFRPYFNFGFCFK